MKRLCLVLCLLLFMTQALSGCQSISQEESSQEEASREQTSENSVGIFYTNETATTLQEYALELSPDMSVTERVETVMEALKNPVHNYVSILPQGLDITYEVVQNEENGAESVILHVVGDYESLTPNVENVFRVGLMKSMIRIPEVYSVELWAWCANEEGTWQEERVSYLVQDTVIVNEADENFFRDTVEVTLYFLNEDSTQLVEETRTATVLMSERLEEKVLAMLIDGPQEEGHRISIPEGTKINEVMVQNGVCYVDLNEAFVRNQVAGEEMEYLTIYSIVKSLTRIYGVDSVQFLIDGQQREFYKSSVRINTPLSYNEEIDSIGIIRIRKAKKE